MYTLVMAAFMLVGAKLGDILGRDRAFGLGLAVYGLGSLITALSPNLTVLLIGWSGIEGLGAVLVIPAIAALTAANYEGKARAFAYSMIGGAAGAAIAAGPLIGGYVTTTWSWRYVFVGEVVVVIAVLIVHRRMKRAPKPEHPPRLDYGGAALSAVALGLIVFGILKSSTWGWIKPIAAPTIGGHEITPLGFSCVPFLIIGGFVVLGCFLAWEERRERLGRSTLLNRALLKIETLRAGLSSLAAQQLIVMGTFFVLPVYLQVVLGFDAFETGKRLFPMSVSMLAAALIGPKVAVRFGPRAVVQIGLGAMAVAALVLVGTIDVTLNGTAFTVSLIFFGIGAGLLMSQLGNVIMSSVPPDRDERGRWTAGDGAKPRRIPRHCADRLRAPARAAQRVQLADPAEPRGAGRREDANRGSHGEGHPHRHERASAPGAARRGAGAGRGRRRHSRLQRRPARRAEDVDARSRLPCGALVLVHAAATRPAQRSRRARGLIAVTTSSQRGDGGRTAGAKLLRTADVPLARLLRKAHPDGQGPVRAAALADRPEPSFASRRRDDERRRLRDRLVHAVRRAGLLQEHRAGLERPQPARDREPRRVASLPRAHPRLVGNAGAADELPPVPVRQVAVGAQRARQRLVHRQARPRPGRRSRASIRSSRARPTPRCCSSSRSRSGSRTIRSGAVERMVGLVEEVGHAPRRRASVPGNDRDDERRAALGVPLLERRAGPARSTTRPSTRR